MSQAPWPACRRRWARIARELLLARLADVNSAGPADYRRMDTLFHLAIAELTGSSLLSTACADARMQLNDLLNAIPVLKLNIAHAAAQHAGDRGRDPGRRSRAGPHRRRRAPGGHRLAAARLPRLAEEVRAADAAGSVLG